jgi:hypothetical protein
MTNRVLLGKFPDGNYGLRISDPGYDVSSNPVNNERLIFNSDWSAILPVYQIGTVSVNNSTTTVNYTDLGYTPFCAALVNIAGRGLEVYNPSRAVIVDRANSQYSPVLNDYSFDGDHFPLVQITAYNNRIVIYASVSAVITYIVYGLKAFS